MSRSTAWQLRGSLFLLALALPVCSSNSNDGAAPGDDLGDELDAPWVGGKADGYSTDRRYEVLLTEPYCDVCQNDDKTYLLTHSRTIQRIVELVDGAQSTIDIAQYTFSRAEIEQALLRAHGRGVRVRIAIDVGQDNDGTVARRLRDGGIEVRFVQGKAAGSQAGLQHNKYMAVDGATLLTGSNNWSSTGTSINEENAVVVGSIASDPLLAGFACDFEAIWAGNHDAAGACSNDTVAFTPSSRPNKRIVNELRAAQSSVDVLMHHLTFSDAIKELAKAAERGVRVRVIVNAEDRGEIKGAAWDRFFAAGGLLRFKLTNASAYQLQHNKLAIFDDKLLLNGSGNWSGSAFFNNYENYVRYAEPEVVDPFRALFARLWRWSLTADSLDTGRSAALQHADETSVYFGNLHAHIYATQGDRILDDAKPSIDDAEGNEIPVDTGASVAEATRYALEYGRDRGQLDFLAITPHTVDDGAGIAADVPSMSVAGYQDIVATSRAVTVESQGGFVGLPGMEWSTNSTGNHVNVLGTEAIAKARFGEFEELYDKFLPLRASAGEHPILQFNHPRTFPSDEGQIVGAWDQLFGIPLTDIVSASERRAKFNDYGLDDYPPMSDVHDLWVEGAELPDPVVVRDTLANIEETIRPYARLMEVTLGRGTEIGHELGQNPSFVPSNDDPTVMVRSTKVHSDWDYYLLNGFMLAPTANHDNHRANWGTGHSSRTAVTAMDLTESALLAALGERLVYASEDQNLVVRLYADGRTAMGSPMATLSGRVTLQLMMHDDDFAGPYDMTLFRGRIGEQQVEPMPEVLGLEGDTWHTLDVDLPEAGRWFVYVEVHEPGPDRMAWTAPIWMERLAP